MEWTIATTNQNKSNETNSMQNEGKFSSESWIKKKNTTKHKRNLNVYE